MNDSSKVAIATVYITVIDNNDNLPQFDRGNYTANVSELEDPEAARILLTVSAEDEDIVSILELMKYDVT